MLFRSPMSYFDHAITDQLVSRVTNDTEAVKTLYVQVANPDGAPANQLTDRTELRALLERAHEQDMAVVPWFLPRSVTPADDLATMKQIVKLRRLLHGLDPVEATELLKDRLQHTKSNKEFLLMVEKTIKSDGD